MAEDKNKEVQQNLEDTTTDTSDDLKLTEEEEELLKKKLAEMRKRDPFVYR